MTQEAFEKGLTEEWTDISDIITVDVNKTYYIQNRGADLLVACESVSAPVDGGGILVRPYRVLKYKKGTGNFYLRAFANTCSINISSEG